MQLFDSKTDLPITAGLFARVLFRWGWEQLAGTSFGTKFVAMSVILWDQMLPEVVSFARTGRDRLLGGLGQQHALGWNLD